MLALWGGRRFNQLHGIELQLACVAVVGRVVGKQEDQSMKLIFDVNACWSRDWRFEIGEGQLQSGTICGGGGVPVAAAVVIGLVSVV